MLKGLALLGIHPLMRVSIREVIHRRKVVFRSDNEMMLNLIFFGDEEAAKNFNFNLLFKLFKAPLKLFLIVFKYQRLDIQFAKLFIAFLKDTEHGHSFFI
jgi:hypothetical protein